MARKHALYVSKETDQETIQKGCHDSNMGAFVFSFDTTLWAVFFLHSLKEAKACSGRLRARCEVVQWGSARDKSSEGAGEGVASWQQQKQVDGMKAWSEQASALSQRLSALWQWCELSYRGSSSWMPYSSPQVSHWILLPPLSPAAN